MYTLEDIHQINNMLLAEVDRICRKHQLRYFMDSGTLIGAVRHHGNIPWDDDVDITMPRKDYEAFIKIAPQEFQDGFELVFPEEYGERSFFDFIPHVAYTKSTICPADGEMAFYRQRMNHILLDIFILDEITDQPAARRRKLFWLHLLYGLSWGHRYHLDYSEYSPMQRIGVAVLSTIGKCFRQTTLSRAFWKCAVSDNGKGYTSCYAANYPFQQIQIIYEKEWFAKSTELDYEGYTFLAPQGYDAVLRAMFGDYMQLPPEEERYSEHYDLNSAYLKISLAGTPEQSKSGAWKPLNGEKKQ